MAIVNFSRSAQINCRHNIVLDTEGHAQQNIAVLLENTVAIYTDIVKDLISISLSNWDALAKLPSLSQQKSLLEHLTHATRSNPAPPNPLDERYPKMPAYLRRSAYADALAAVKGWIAQVKAWAVQAPTTRGAKPTLGYPKQAFPTMYREGAYKKGKRRWVSLQLHNGKDWQWCDVPLAFSQFKQITKYMNDPSADISAPTLKKKGRKWKLEYLITTRVEKLADESPGKARVCGIDLGVNTAATCVVMESDGTVIARKFVKLAKEEDRLNRALGRLRKRQAQGARKNRRFWDFIKNLNHELGVKTVGEIMEFALSYGCTTLACEYLNMSGRVRGTRKQRLAVWRAREVYEMLASSAHKKGMHIHQVSAKNTSRLAFDGSGKVSRGLEIAVANGTSSKFGWSWVRFSTGKMYNADLNAALNIAARCFIKLYSKAMPAREWSEIEAKVPGLARRTECVLSTLIDLGAVLRAA